MNKVELLSPVGDFESLVSAVQNGADAVYFGANKFNARMNGKNFSEQELKDAIKYAKLRNVKTHLTLNTLVKNEEFEEAIEIVKFAYKVGIDVVIVQDLGLANIIISNFPKLEVHASTQMTTYNLNGVKELQKLGYDRVVLSRELTLEEIREICENSKMDIEVFAHGALCISYSGQCLMSSIIGGRSGNRGKCAGTCRLPYELINKSKNRSIEKGYLLSSKDVCTLDILPELISSGVKSLKIEGRMKSSEYVGIVTSIYRKYIDLVYSKKEYIVENEDKEKLMQIFNRGGFSTGYLNGKLGKKMIYSQKPNHIGVYIGDVISYNPNKGYVKIKLCNNIKLGDSISINEYSCKTSELMQNNNNIKTANKFEEVVIGRINGRILKGDKVYKTVSQELMHEINESSNKESCKREINAIVKLEKYKKIEIQLEDVASGLMVVEYGECVEKAEKTAIDNKRIKQQICKTGNTVFKISDIKIMSEQDATISIKSINEVRRTALEKLENKIINSFDRKLGKDIIIQKSIKSARHSKTNLSILLNNINETYDYGQLNNIDKVYIPIKKFIVEKNKNCLEDIIEKFDTYLYFPAITKGVYQNIIKQNIDSIINRKIKGFVISNISQYHFVKKYNKEIIANYTMNIINDWSVAEIEKFGFSMITMLPELNKFDINSINTKLKKEMIVYGRTLLMNSEYCPIGTFYKCNGDCKNGEYILKDRKSFEFPIVTDRINCNSMIYNSKITSINWEDLEIDSIRIDILNESIEEIKMIIDKHKNNIRLEGQEYTSGNLNKEI